MLKPLRIFASVGLVAGFAAATLSLSTASAAVRGHAITHLIDTDVVVGFPQHATVPSTQQARPGAPISRSDPVAPTIITEPASETVTVGANVAFSASASGTPAPTMQWELSTNEGERWSSIRGATATTYSFSATAGENGYEYEAVFRNTAGSATTTPATLTVTTGPPVAPTITSNPLSETVASGATATFSASASGTPTPTVQWEVSTNGGGTFSNVSGPTSTTYSVTAASSENGYEYEAVFTNTAGSVTTTPATLTVTVAPVESSNWSGYSDLDATFSAASASWTVPTVSCPSRSSSYSAQWVGIDGYSSSTVEQDGTEADCIDGSPSYYAWFEMYGDSAVNGGDEVELLPSGNLVSPGDPVTASVADAGGTWTLTISDSSNAHPWSYTAHIVFTSAAQSSAEWIVERPEICSRTCSLTSLADFGSVNFTGASVTSSTDTGSISSNLDTPIDMVNGRTLLATPGALDAAGDSFTNTWQAT